MLAAPSGPMTAISASGHAKETSAPELPAAHREVGAAVGLPQDEGDLGHGGLAVGVEHLGAVADDAAVLLVGAGQEAGHVDDGEQRQAERVAGADEPRGLVGGVDVETARADLRLGWR